MTDPIIMTIISTTIKSLFDLRNELKTVYKVGKDEIKHLLDDGLLSYANSQKEKFEKTKTFLYRDDRINFYDTFFPLDLSGTRPNGESYSVNMKKPLTQTFNDGNCVTIIGDAGSGKSMLMKHFFLQFLNEEKIPLFIELRNLNSFDGSFYEYIIKSIFNNRLSPNDSILERLVSNGKFLFLLDGYDELHDEVKRIRKDEINQFIDKYRKNYFVISSRPGASAETLPRFTNLKVSQISEWKIIDFVKKQLSILENKEVLEKKIIEVIDDPKNMDYKNYMSNPLLLTMFIFTFKKHPEIPHTKSRFYYNVFDTLCTSHDNISKHGDLHERKTKLKIEDFEEILKWFSFYSYFEGQFNFDKQYLVLKLEFIKKKKGYDFDIEDLIYDLTVNIAIIIIDGLEYKFPHRSLQEYFIALLISQINSNKKSEIYKTKYFNDELNPEYNLWAISEEIDTYYFKIALVSKLGEILNLFKGNNLILKYLELSKISLVFEKTRGQFSMLSNYDWANTLYYLDSNSFVFHFFQYNETFQNLIDSYPNAPKIVSQRILSFHYIEEIDELLEEDPILETEDNIAIRLHENISNHLLPYLKEIGLDNHIETLLYTIEHTKNKLEKSIVKIQQIEDELFDFH